MVDDAYQNPCDHLILISGDSDLVPAAAVVRERFPEKKVTVYVPSASLEYDNTTATTILASVKTNSTGPIGGYFLLVSGFDKQTNQVGFTFEDGTFGLLGLAIPSTSAGAILPGAYTTNAFLTNDYPPFNHANASAMVTVTPEPSAWMLVLERS